MKTKKTLGVILTVCLLAQIIGTTTLFADPVAWDGNVASAFAGGSGGIDDPYQIANGGQLAYLAQLVNAGNTSYNSAYYIITEDINLGSKPWLSIGNTATNSFFGNLNGNGKIISNLSLSSADAASGGLFGYIGSASSKTAKIKELGLSNVTITNSNATSANVGSFCYYNYGTISGCYIKGLTVIQSNNKWLNAAGFAFTNFNVIEYCYIWNVTRTSNAGGRICAIAKNNGDSVMRYCYSAGTITGGYYSVVIYPIGLRQKSSNTSTDPQYYLGTVTDCYSYNTGKYASDLQQDDSNWSISAGKKVTESDLKGMTGEVSLPTSGVYYYKTSVGSCPVLNYEHAIEIYSITVDTMVNGSVNSASSMAEGGIVTLTVLPDTGYQIDWVKYNGIELAPVAGAYSFAMPAGDVTITAQFSQKVVKTYVGLGRYIYAVESPLNNKLIHLNNCWNNNATLTNIENDPYNYAKIESLNTAKDNVYLAYWPSTLRQRRNLKGTLNFDFRCPTPTGGYNTNAKFFGIRVYNHKSNVTLVDYNFYPANDGFVIKAPDASATTALSYDEWYTVSVDFDSAVGSYKLTVKDSEDVSQEVMYTDNTKVIVFEPSADKAYDLTAIDFRMNGIENYNIPVHLTSINVVEEAFAFLQSAYVSFNAQEKTIKAQSMGYRINPNILQSYALILAVYNESGTMVKCVTRETRLDAVSTTSVMDCPLSTDEISLEGFANGTYTVQTMLWTPFAGEFSLRPYYASKSGLLTVNNGEINFVQ